MPQREVKRFEDMSPDGYLKLIQQTDGDIIIVVYSGEEADTVPLGISVEFCVSGTDSPGIVHSLAILMEEIEKLNG